jgi:hypothetical protein
MRISGIIWLEDILDKLERKLAVKQNEVKQVFANSPYFRFVEKVIVEAKMFTLRWGKRRQVGI